MPYFISFSFLISSPTRKWHCDTLAPVPFFLAPHQASFSSLGGVTDVVAMLVFSPCRSDCNFIGRVHYTSSYLGSKISDRRPDLCPLSPSRVMLLSLDSSHFISNNYDIGRAAFWVAIGHELALQRCDGSGFTSGERYKREGLDGPSVLLLCWSSKQLCRDC